MQTDVKSALFFFFFFDIRISDSVKYLLHDVWCAMFLTLARHTHCIFFQACLSYAMKSIGFLVRFRVVPFLSCFKLLLYKIADCNALVSARLMVRFISITLLIKRESILFDTLIHYLYDAFSVHSLDAMPMRNFPTMLCTWDYKAMAKPKELIPIPSPISC